LHRNLRPPVLSWGRARICGDHSAETPLKKAAAVVSPEHRLAPTLKVELSGLALERLIGWDVATNDAAH
jgi:hypothetical protein